MARVSLIPVVDPRAAWPSDRLDAFREALETAGHSVTMLAVNKNLAADPVWQAIHGIRAASEPLLVVVDMAMAYSAADVQAVVDRLDSGTAELVIAARRGRWVGPVARKWLGVSDLTSGLVGLTKRAADDANATFAPVGTRFAIELLARVRGDRAEVIVAPVAGPRRRWVPLDDVRHAKRIADERLGTLSRLMQFCFVGASGMVVDLTSYATLQAVLGLTPLKDWSIIQVVGGNSVTVAQAMAGLLAIATAIVWNFSLNRRLTFNDARRGSIVHQFFRYVLSNLAGCAVSLAFRLLLPSRIEFFARHRLAAAVTGIVAATGISFTLARWFVFRTRTERVGTSVEPLLDPIAH